jgi:two-component system OmpR family response regulator/two-component system response regulator RstA
MKSKATSTQPAMRIDIAEEAEAPVSADLSVLLVEDDRRLADLVAEYMSRHGIEVHCETRGDRACARVSFVRPQLVILDLMLPGKDGFAICRELRASHPNLPIIMLTARDEDFDRVLGLELGADNYLQKPIEPRVLLAHVRALMRRVEGRGEAPANHERLVFGALTIDYAAREVTLAGQRIELSASEFDLLWLLARHAGQVLSRDEILHHVRNLEYDGVNRSVDYRIFRLRRKLGDENGGPERIKTIRGAGYLFAAGSW